MLRVLFFARAREELACPGLDIPWEDALADVDALQAKLCRDGGPSWAKVLGRPGMIRAVNQQVARGDTALRDGDEVAFFPPVTGG